MSALMLFIAHADPGLKLGAMLADDSVTVGGTLLAVCGQHVSDELQERVTDLRAIVRQPLRVLAAALEP
jgi:hypothetical protein